MDKTAILEGAASELGDVVAALEHYAHDTLEYHQAVAALHVVQPRGPHEKACGCYSCGVAWRRAR